MTPAASADLVIGEILGWDACRHLPLQVALQATMTLRGLAPGPSVHSVLDDGLHRLASGDTHALSPRPNLNRRLHRLVQLVTRNFGADLDAPPTARDRFHLDVVGHVFHRLDNDPKLAARAATVRRGAAAAEEAMEHHYTRLAVEALDRTLDHAIVRPDPDPDAGPAGLTGQRIDALRSALGTFPYTHNYERLTMAELAGLEAAGHQVSSRSSVAFCGAGPLPLTGILVHVLTGARVTLVEIDVEAAGIAQRLIDHLARLGVVGPGSLRMVLGDAAEADLTGCEVVVVASLIGAETVLRLVTSLATSLATAPVLLVRSAAGMVSRFAYEPVHLEALTALGCHHLGEVTPLTSLTSITCGDSSMPVDRSVAVPSDSPTLLAVADSEVLNRTELFSLVR